MAIYTCIHIIVSKELLCNVYKIATQSQKESDSNKNILYGGGLFVLTGFKP